MSSSMRYLVVSYFIAGIISVYLVSKLVMGVMDTVGIEDPFARYIPISSIIGVIAGAIVFGILFKHARVNDFGQEVVKEVSKVTWPTVPETRASTVVVIILVIIISIILGIFDYIFASLTSIIYS